MSLLSKLFLIIVLLVAIAIGLYYQAPELLALGTMEQDPPLVVVRGINWMIGALQSLQVALIPPQAHIVLLSTAYFKSQAIYVTTKLRVADHLSNGPLTIREIAQRANVTNANNLYRIMRALSAEGIFREMSHGVFENTALSHVMRSDVPDSSYYTVLHMVGQCYGSWHKLLHALDMNDGDVMSYGDSGKTFWQVLDENKEESAIFDKSMRTLSMQTHGWLSADYDFSQYGTIVDVGGGEGALLSAILSRHESVKGILFDRPLVIEHAKQSQLSLDSHNVSGLASRMNFVSGDFFDSVPAGGDAYLLRLIIHDWNDEDSVRILKTVRKAINTKKSNATLIVIEQLIEDTVHNNVFDARWSDLHMMVMLNARERTLNEFRSMFDAAGFTLVDTFRGRSPLSLIIGKPK